MYTVLRYSQEVTNLLPVKVKLKDFQIHNVPVYRKIEARANGCICGKNLFGSIWDPEELALLSV
jgi:hypothetical protein